MESHAVVWEEPGGPRYSGTLSIEGSRLVMRGHSLDGEVQVVRLAPGNVARVRVERKKRAGNEEDDARTLIVERYHDTPLHVRAVAGAGVLFEIAMMAADVASLTPGRYHKITIRVPLRAGASERAREHLQRGPSFDPETVAGLEHHEVELGRDEVVFVFEGRGVQEMVDHLVRMPRMWVAAAVWSHLIAGPPEVLETVYRWDRTKADGDAPSDA